MLALLAFAGHLWRAGLAALGVLAAGAWYGFPVPQLRAVARSSRRAGVPVSASATSCREAASLSAWRAFAPGLAAFAVVILLIALASL